MTNKTLNLRKNFVSRLDFVCSRDEKQVKYHYIYFKNGFAYAMNEFSLIKQDLKLCGFDGEEIILLEGKCVHKDDFKLIFNHIHIRITAQGIDAGTLIYKLFNPKNVINFEKFFERHEQLEPTGRDKVILNRVLVFDMLNAVHTDKNEQAIEFYFPGDSVDGIIVNSEIPISKQMGIIMPMKIE